MSNQIYTISKFVDAILAKYPGAKKLAVIINSNHLNKTKFNYITNPIAVFVEKEKLDNEELLNILGVEQFTISIKGSQYSYMNSRKSYTYWSLVIDCNKQTKKVDDEDYGFKEASRPVGSYEYYPTSLYFIKDQKFIESLLPQPKEFNFDDYI